MFGAEVQPTGLPHTRTFLTGRDACRIVLTDGIYLFGSPTTVMFRADLVRGRTPFYAEGRLFEDGRGLLRAARRLRPRLRPPGAELHADRERLAVARHARLQRLAAGAPQPARPVRPPVPSRPTSSTACGAPASATTGASSPRPGWPAATRGSGSSTSRASPRSATRDRPQGADPRRGAARARLRGVAAPARRAAARARPAANVVTAPTAPPGAVPICSVSVDSLPHAYPPRLRPFIGCVRADGHQYPCWA